MRNQFYVVKIIRDDREEFISESLPEDFVSDHQKIRTSESMNQANTFMSKSDAILACHSLDKNNVSSIYVLTIQLEPKIVGAELFVMPGTILSGDLMHNDENDYASQENY